MTLQFSFFYSEGHTEDGNADLLEGCRYQPELIDSTEEDTLLSEVRHLPFREFEFHNYKGKRRVVSFGWKYDFSGRRLEKADAVPEFLIPLRARAAAFARVEPELMEQALVTEYGPGAGIGWHRDKGVFGEVVGISLVSPCVLRFRRKADPNEATVKIEAKAGIDPKRMRLKMNAKWERINLLAERRSAYHLTGPARAVWEHSILRVDALRYSITFRTLKV